MRSWSRLPLVAATLATTAAPAPANESPAGTGQAQLLGTFSDSDDHGAFRLSLGACAGADRRRCPVELVRSENGRESDRVSLSDAACGPAHAVAADASFGTVADASAWVSESPGCRFAIAVRTFEVAPGQSAILVTTRLGSSPQRQHALYLPTSGKLRAAWTGAPDGLRVALIPPPPPSGTDAHQDLVTIDVRSDGGPVKAVHVKRFQWEPPVTRFSDSDLPDQDRPLFLVVAGSFDSTGLVERARTGAHAACFDGYDLFPASLFPGLGLRGLSLALLTTSRGDAERAQRAGAACTGRPFSLIEYVPRVEFTVRK